MAKRKVLDKAKAREKRDQLLASAAAARLSLTDGVRTMREIAGMTQEEFARHRGVSARAIKALELGQGNPTVALLNRVGEFFGLEVAFVPKRPPPEPDGVGHRVHTTETAFAATDSQLVNIDLLQQQVKEMARLNSQLENLGSLNARLEGIERLATELEQLRTSKGS
ncbi:helix-turn-helix transcriptional regulator [Massilia brevitalea]|uniref:helix-turn-helix transcriptional regulator n=1 Tax=Massilia brevitalea TaxID=442526 RepID=UPI00273A454E|nr:helix-turn-helix transcriptional regulator [Massilia brevitalea]